MKSLLVPTAYALVLPLQNYNSQELIATIWLGSSLQPLTLKVDTSQNITLIAGPGSKQPNFYNTTNS
jgi:hypothetical protein